MSEWKDKPDELGLWLFTTPGHAPVLVNVTDLRAPIDGGIAFTNVGRTDAEDSQRYLKDYKRARWFKVPKDIPPVRLEVDKRYPVEEGEYVTILVEPEEGSFRGVVNLAGRSFPIIRSYTADGHCIDSPYHVTGPAIAEVKPLEDSEG